ncbi:MAG TPA: DUF3492 domain-containing protein, partial [Acidimicrobiales bacterium]|nr:DUF3492 domain-containing protein [Acidimicrobiales bacterium]
MRVLLSTEGTYPFVEGGVSTWAHCLVGGLAHHRFLVLAICANPTAHARFRPPANAQVTPVPLWGFELLEEHLERPGGLRRRARTGPRAVAAGFLPHL